MKVVALLVTDKGLGHFLAQAHPPVTWQTGKPLIDNITGLEPMLSDSTNWEASGANPVRFVPFCALTCLPAQSVPRIAYI